ncbi:unnamed protein product [Rotaria magnacalcarata]|uniref:Uncharacterized protein n=1 Tax=Rotaria magnacalcarata TaxID=392030 RepID=A0A816PP84_9BILA|nr:unnamed protein product [Rotaria magnacalcarata]CAF2051047.1 unnamed protein product [Rotaria magnacalcarata]CAF2147870.1 unnamed protein product [Rotaria magnacalcarata]CAF3938080.1 unnamed protein product [Rotaria magnacalcarata]CAF4012627.1 unnamed protein product [Rotaria magnacalcarata]
MRYYLIFIVFNIFYLSINAQSEDSSTVYTIAQNVTEEKTTFATTTEYNTATGQSTEQKTNDQASMYTILDQITSISNISSTTTVSNKPHLFSYAEPPLHPLGYCVHSYLRCSKIRRCCKGPCDVNSMRCP